MVSFVKLTLKLYCVYTHLIGAIPLPNYYNNYYHPSYIYNLNCTGVENNIWDCPYDDSYMHYCKYNAAVMCQCKHAMLGSYYVFIHLFRY